jgi:hypothetical protein
VTRLAPLGLVALVWLAGVGCSKRSDSGAGPVSPVKPQPEDTSFRLPAAERIVAIGDLHGDMTATRTALQLAGAIDASDHWIGGRLLVVQTGDQLDRGDDEPEILDLFERLRAEARAAGGALLALNGNHEVMNVQGDYRYVTHDGFHDWPTAPGDGPRARLAQQLPVEQRGRAAAFLPGGEVAKRLAQQPIVLQVGDNVFVHGGVLETHVRYGLARINREVQAWMSGAPSAHVPFSVANDAAPIWSRDYSQGTPAAAKCAELARVLHQLSARRMIVGHTVQQTGINSACDGQVWRIDVGLARHFGGKPSVLEIRGDALHVIEVPQGQPVSNAGSVVPAIEKRAPNGRRALAQQQAPD